MEVADIIFRIALVLGAAIFLVPFIWVALIGCPCDLCDEWRQECRRHYSAMHSALYWFKTKVLRMKLIKMNQYRSWQATRCLKMVDGKQCRKGYRHMTSCRG